MFDPLWKLGLGLLTGMIFGLRLQKGRVAKFHVIVNQFLFRDWTVVKIMGTAVVVGAIGIYALLPSGAVSLHIKPLVWLGIVVGGLCFGAGMAIFGYCPGTSVAACGEGRRDAMVGVLGMLLGAGIYVAFYPQLSGWLKSWGDAGKLTLPQWTETSPWLWLAGLCLLAAAGFAASARGARFKKTATSLLAAFLLWPATVAHAADELPTPYPYSEPAWSPYVVGALIGTLVLTTLVLASKKIGASSAYSDVAGMLGRLVAPQHIASLPYYRKSKPMVGWTLMIVVGAVLGSFLAAWSGGELTGSYLQEMWVARFGEDSQLLRTGVALTGGAFMAFGARMAGGCTSGHGISGTLQLAVGSWIAVICFFVGGMATAWLMYRL